ncbi:response regulator transcription factor [Ktedonosporobacter rubrisoli]|uniref:Response regulator transcription factor n=1 Tax=Ktedonosporobacter rubrisoli TaxID=2509675 RepID=A0A4P6K5B4_KTERU|nr:response regulator transcription factor [Ktedonosporobacter rubrisoli]QBD83050.1 response regulator transcription factor [Ktedonosporobacter rubrisoli]
MTIRVLIVDDHSVVREGLRVFLGRDPALEVVDEAANGPEAIEKARLWRPDIVLMDLLIPIMDGIETTTIIRHELPETQVVVLTNVLDSTSVTNAIRAGAIGYMLKNVQATELHTAIKAAAAGQMHLSPQASTYLLREVRDAESVCSLTERETNVLNLLAQGCSNKEIAQVLHIAEDTVKTHIRHILAKLGVQSRTQATLAAMRLGLVAQQARSIMEDRGRGYKL